MRILCETFIPLLALALLWAEFRAPGPPWIRLGATLAAIGAVYLLTWADRSQGWWASWGLDFSTHTGIATVLAVSLAFHGMRQLLSGALLLLAYGAMMVVVGYHTAADIVTSAAAVLPAGVAAPGALAVRRRRRRVLRET